MSLPEVELRAFSADEAVVLGQRLYDLAVSNGERNADVIYRYPRTFANLRSAIETVSRICSDGLVGGGNVCAWSILSEGVVVGALHASNATVDNTFGPRFYCWLGARRLRPTSERLLPSILRAAAPALVAARMERGKPMALVGVDQEYVIEHMLDPENGFGGFAPGSHAPHTYHRVDGKRVVRQQYVARSWRGGK